MIKTIVKYSIIKTGLLFLLGIIILFSCDDTPPKPIDFPPVMTCTITGDINIDFSSSYGSVGTNVIGVNQFYITSNARIGGIKYDVFVSPFFVDKEEPDSIPIIYTTDSIDGNYAWAGVVEGLGTKNQVDYWADSGYVIIDKIYNDLGGIYIKGSFNFFASDDSRTLHIIVVDGFIDLERSF